MRRTWNWLGFALLATLFSCAPPTVFSGEAKIQGGAAGCEAKCKALGLEMVGMVLMGEYSDGCVCKKPGAQLSLAPVQAAMGATQGVIAEMRKAEAERLRNAQWKR